MEPYITITLGTKGGTIHCDRPLLTSKGKPQQRLIDALDEICGLTVGNENEFSPWVTSLTVAQALIGKAGEEGWIEKGAIVVNEESTDETFDDDEQFDEPFVTLIRLNPGGRLLCNKPLRRELIAILGHYFSVEVDELGRFHPKIIGEDRVVRFLSNCEQWIQNGAISVKEKAHDPDPHIQIIPVTGDIIPHVPTKPEAPTSDIETRLTRVEQESTEAKKRLDAGFTELKRLDTVLSALESGLPNLLDQQ
jgi:hypothetical protein